MTDISMLNDTITTETNYFQHEDTVAEAVWNQWTINWPEAHSDYRLCEQTTKTAANAVNNAWCDGMTVREWADAALAQLK